MKIYIQLLIDFQNYILPHFNCSPQLKKEINEKVDELVELIGIGY